MIPTRLIFAIVLCFVAWGLPAMVNAHCEVPCGIYGDEARVQTIGEHIKTIETAMRQINAMGLENPTNHNQMIRWVVTKENHAEKIQHIVSQYFMTQRVKPGKEKTGDMLDLLHKMLVTAMKCKQTTDLKQPEELRRLLKAFDTLYFNRS